MPGSRRPGAENALDSVETQPQGPRMLPQGAPRGQRPSPQQLGPARSWPVPVSSQWESKDSGSSRDEGSVPVARGLPGGASSEVSVSCLGVEGSLCAARGPPSGLQALLSASARRSSHQPSPHLSPYVPSLTQGAFLGRVAPQAPAWHPRLFPTSPRTPSPHLGFLRRPRHCRTPSPPDSVHYLPVGDWP